MIIKVRKRPVEVSAVRFTGDNYDDVWELTGPEAFAPQVAAVDAPDIIAAVFDRLHATWVGVKAEQWIIQGVKGEFYPCDPDVFEETYEAVADSTRQAQGGYVKYQEVNEHEGETWTFWLSTRGNGPALGRLQELLTLAHEAHDEFPYSLWLNVIRPGETVDAFVSDADGDTECYYPAHTKVTGRLTIPEDLGVGGSLDSYDLLYKGGIGGLFSDG